MVATDDGIPDWRPPSALPAGVGDDPGAWHRLFLGLSPDGPRFAVSPHREDALLDSGAEWSSIRSIPGADIGGLLTAASLVNWHATHTHCPRCGRPTAVRHGGWQRRCEHDNSDHFPRVDPAVIMLVHDGSRALLGRNGRWPATWFSTFAGFVEPGESLEGAVERELAEEVGVRARSCEYLASQPWPFPNSLMVGFHVRVDPGRAVPDGDEIAEAVWVDREQLARECEAGTISLPPSASISRWLIQRWFGAPLAGSWSRG
jgi:NAD+ diphosphatase